MLSKIITGKKWKLFFGANFEPVSAHSVERKTAEREELMRRMSRGHQSDLSRLFTTHTFASLLQLLLGRICDKFYFHFFFPAHPFSLLLLHGWRSFSTLLMTTTKALFQVWNAKSWVNKFLDMNFSLYRKKKKCWMVHDLFIADNSRVDSRTGYKKTLMEKLV